MPIKMLVLNLVTQLGACVRELWMELKSFLHTHKDATTEMWRCLTKENVTTIFALAHTMTSVPIPALPAGK